MRRTLLFLPGNNPGNVQSGGVFGADGVILDLEDAVSPLEKDAARNLVAQALQTVDYHGCETVVRVNPLVAKGAKDIKVIVPCEPDALMLPKIECAADVKEQIALIKSAEKPGQKPVLVMPLLETPMGVAHALEIALSDDRVTAICLGAEDYTAGLGTARSKEGTEIFMARAVVANASAAANIDGVDTPFTDVQDEAGLIKDTMMAKNMGFKGKLSINPRQIDAIHNVYAPTGAEISWALRVLQAIEEGKNRGTGVIAVNGKMIDAPIVSRANRTIELAKLLNLLEVE
ncbi:MAG: CoA ester lyase [Megasphaera sp.]|jgi:citrate lyase subunit beta/citryl-CoA lyase|nr:CoA ester lyase [Megasphaera sp.]MCI1824059.1 CoA ester lyase [Megasphaera sp.]